MFERILVPLDGSELAEQALTMAIKLARESQGTLCLLRSTVGMVLPAERAYIGPYGPYDWLPSIEVIEEIEREAKRYLGDVSGKYVSPEINWEKYVAKTDPAAAIVDYAQNEAIDLIVMSSHGHSGVERWALGSVTERVVRHAPCPIFVVRSTTPMRRILIPLDGSELAEAALAPALEVARLLGAAVTLLRVAHITVPDDITIAQLEGFEHGLGEGLRHGAVERAESYLQATRVQCQAEDLPVDSVVLEGRPAPEILDYAAHHNVDLIAMATHGRSGIRRWIYGSVSEKVLRATPCSLLIVRPPLGE